MKAINRESKLPLYSQLYAILREKITLGDWQPGELIHIESVCEQLRPEAAWLLGEVRSVNGPISRSRFLLMNVGHLESARKDSITFHNQFMEHFDIRQKIMVPSERTG